MWMPVDHGSFGNPNTSITPVKNHPSLNELGEMLGNWPLVVSLVRTTNLFNPHPSAIKPVCSNHYIDRDSVGWISINRNILHVFH